MMTSLDGAIVALRYHRVIVLARDDDQAHYDALRAFGVRTWIAAAVAARLVTVRVEVR